MAFRISQKGKYQFTCLQSDINGFTSNDFIEEGMIGFVTDRGVEVIHSGGQFIPQNVKASVYVTNTDAVVNGIFTTIEFLSADVTFTTLTSNLKTAAGAAFIPSASTFPVGYKLTGLFTSVKLSAGKVLLIP